VINTHINNDQISDSKIEFIYGYDALCGWCYGFCDELDKVYAALSTKVNFTLLNGGLFARDGQLKMTDMKDHIKRNMGYVSQKTGRAFGESFISGVLEESEYLYDSKTSAIAIAVIKDMLPAKTFEFSANIQKAFFYQGKDIQSDEFYLALISEYSIVKEDFLYKLHSRQFAQYAEAEFKQAADYGFTSFPSCLLIKGNQRFFLSHDYSAISIIENIEDIIQR